MIAHLLQPAGDEGFRKALLPVLFATVMPNTDGMSDESQQAFFAAKASEYSRLLSHYPVDIIRSACDAHARRSKFFPAVAELNEFAEPALALRQRQAQRIAELLKTGGKPTKPAFVPEPPHVRLLSVLKWQERSGSHLFNPTKAAATRRDLQKLVDDEFDAAARENRDPADWTIGLEHVGVPVFTEAPIESAAAPAEIAGTLPRDGAAWTKASDAAPGPWKAGQPIYQKPPAEEPPMPDEIPEGDAR